MNKNKVVKELKKGFLKACVFTAVFSLPVLALVFAIKVQPMIGGLLSIFYFFGADKLIRILKDEHFD